MRLARAIPICILFLLLAAGAASAITNSSRQPFATTRSATVSWSTVVDLNVSTFTVTSTRLTIDGVGFDVQPSSGSATVTITAWSLDHRAFYVNRTPAAQATLSITNPGHLIDPYENGTAITDCEATTSPCLWLLANSTSTLVRLYFNPTGESNEAGGNAGDNTPIEGGGGGGSSSPPPVDSLPGPLPPLPNPVKLFPRLGAFQWASVLAGLALLLNSGKRTQKVLPAFARIPGPALPKALVGAIIIALVYLSTPPI